MKTMKIWKLASGLWPSHLTLGRTMQSPFSSRLISVFVMLAAFSLASCDKDDPFEETDSGKNTLGFLLNGKKVEYAWQPIFPFTDYELSVSAQELRNDTLHIYARLEPIEDLRGASIISINLPIKKLSTGAILENEADIELVYLAGSKQEGEITYMYSNSLDITASRVGIRTCKRGKVLSGNFEFEGDAHFMDGTDKHCKITDGHFDVKWQK